MTTMKEAIQYRIHQISEQIAQCKAAAFKIDTVNYRYAEIQFGGKTLEEGFTQKRIFHINPGHSDWPRYQHLKRQASICLTMLHILRAFDGVIHPKTMLRKEMRKGSFSQHASKDVVKRNSLIIEAYRNLVELEKDLSLNPSRFEEAGKHAVLRRQEAAKRKEQADANA